MLVDDVTVNIRAGKGGDGTVSFRKAMMELGPSGGSGGKGGSVYIKGVADIGALQKFRFRKNIVAGDGKNGLLDNRSGEDGKDVYLEVPVGTVIHYEEGKKREVEKIGEEVMIAQGGRGGKGNFHFRSSINTSPEDFEYGKEGDFFVIRFELKLIADVGFVGLPNTGKSSLLNELTGAKSKVANYPFTTLEPSLGAYYELILADIPGLIQGASSGKGLGIKFLRHIERTNTLFHFIAADSKNPLEDYETIRRELKEHQSALVEKEEYIILSKKDEVSKERISEVEKKLSKVNEKIIPLSVLEEESIKPLQKVLGKLALEKKKE